MQIDRVTTVKLVLIFILLFIATPLLLSNPKKEAPPVELTTSAEFNNELPEDIKLYVTQKVASYIESSAQKQAGVYTLTNFTDGGGGFTFSVNPEKPGKSVQGYIVITGFGDVQLYADGVLL